VINDVNSDQLYLYYFAKNEKMPVEIIDKVAYECLREYMFRYNATQKNIKYSNGKITYLKETFNGIKRLWELTFNCDKEVKALSAKDICEIYANLYKDVKVNFIKIFDSVIKSGLDYVTEVTFSKGVFNHFLEILKLFANK